MRYAPGRSPGELSKCHNAANATQQHLQLYGMGLQLVGHKMNPCPKLRRKTGWEGNGSQMLS